MTSFAPTYRNHRYPIEIVSRAVWLYFRFNVSLREVEEMMLERGIVVSYEAIRRWCKKHGSNYTRRLRRKAPASGFRPMAGSEPDVCLKSLKTESAHSQLK